MSKNARFYIGTVVVGCATDFKLTIKADKLSTVCQGSGDVKTSTPGMIEYTWECSGLTRQFDDTEETTNISILDWIDSINAGTVLTVKFEGTTTGDATHSLNAYVENISMTHKVNEVGTYQASGWGNSYTKTVKS